VNVKVALCVRFLHLRAIRDPNCMPFFSSRHCSICMSASIVLILEHSSLLCLSVAECRSVYSTVKYEWPSKRFSVAYTQKLEISTKIDVYSYRWAHRRACCSSGTLCRDRGALMCNIQSWNLVKMTWKPLTSGILPHIQFLALDLFCSHPISSPYEARYSINGGSCTEQSDWATVQYLLRWRQRK